MTDSRKVIVSIVASVVVVGVVVGLVLAFAVIPLPDYPSQSVQRSGLAMPWFSNTGLFWTFLALNTAGRQRLSSRTAANNVALYPRLTTGP